MPQSIIRKAKRHLKFAKYSTDGITLTLVCKATVILHILGATFLVCQQLFGVTIDCDLGRDPPQNMLAFCKMTSMTTRGNPRYDSDTTTHHRYYKWVPLSLLFMAGMFYLPKVLWNVFEGGRIAFICDGMKHGTVDEQEEDKRGSKLHSYFTNTKDKNKRYCFLYVTCELVALLLLVLDIIVTNVRLDGYFIQLGYKTFVTGFDKIFLDGPDKDFYPLMSVFPRLTRCAMSKFSGSGDYYDHEALCAIPLNDYNEKLFIGLWCWYAFLIVTIVTAIVLRCIGFCSANLREFKMSLDYHGKAKDLTVVTSKSSYQDWFFLTLIQKNVHPAAFANLIAKVAEDERGEMEEKEKDEKDEEKRLYGFEELELMGTNNAV